jgi:putative copper resistance protein D
VNPDGIAVAERAAALVCLYQAAGAAFFVVLFQAQLPEVRGRICRLGAGTALCGIALVLLQPPLMAARMAGDFAGLFNGPLLRVALHSSNGAAHAVQVLGLSLIVIGLRSQRVTAWLAVLGAALAAGALVLTGHTSVRPQRALLASLLSVHLLIVAFWFGALRPLWLAVQHEKLADAARVLRRFSRLAAWLVPCIALAGLSLAWLLIGSWSVLRRAYGLLLVAKLCVFVLLMGLAALNRWRYLPGLAAGSPPARRALQRSIVAEYLLIALVLAMTAALTMLFSPED